VSSSVSIQLLDDPETGETFISQASLKAVIHEIESNNLDPVNGLSRLVGVIKGADDRDDQSFSFPKTKGAGA
jgi:hypothetical protein